MELEPKKDALNHKSYPRSLSVKCPTQCFFGLVKTTSIGINSYCNRGLLRPLQAMPSTWIQSIPLDQDFLKEKPQVDWFTATIQIRIQCLAHEFNITRLRCPSLRGLIATAVNSISSEAATEITEVESLMMYQARFVVPDRTSIQPQEAARYPNGEEDNLWLRRSG